MKLSLTDTDKAEKPVDGFTSIEKGVQDKANAMSAAARLEALQDINDEKWSDPYTLSQSLRKTFRAEKAIRKKRQADDENLRNRYGLAPEINLPEESQSERDIAKFDFAKGARQFRTIPKDSEYSKRRKLISDVNVASSSRISAKDRPSLKIPTGITSKSAKLPTMNATVTSLASRLISSSSARRDPFSNSFKTPSLTKSLIKS